MSWLTVIWTAGATGSAFMAVVHAVLWVGDRRKQYYLFGSMACLGAAATGINELLLMKADSVEAAERLISWQNVAIFLLIVSLTWFVFGWFETGRRWLAWSITLLWCTGLVVNFAMPGNLVFTEINALLERETPWGEPYHLVTGVTNPLKWLADGASLLFFLFVVDATIRSWRHRHRRKVMAGCSMIVFIVVAGVHTPLVDSGVIESPFIISFAFLAIVLALTVLLLRDVIRARRVEEALRDTQATLHVAARLSLFGELSSAFAHELNQPLAAILSNAQAGRRFLQGGEPDLREVASIFDDIVRDDKHAGEVVNRLRALIKREDITMERFDLHTLIDESLDLCRGEIEAASVEVVRKFNAGDFSIEAGRVELQQVLLNLFTNAIHAMSDGERRVLTVTTDAESDRHELRICDTGTGIPEELLDSLFKPFATTRADGLGMGLAISKRFLELHGSGIEARNHPDGGAEFVVTIPRRSVVIEEAR